MASAIAFSSTITDIAINWQKNVIQQDECYPWFYIVLLVLNIVCLIYKALF